MSKSKWKYYVAVYENDGSLHYVTDLDFGSGRAIWENGKEAKEFKLTTATDICEGLNANLIHSVVVKLPIYMIIGNGN